MKELLRKRGWIFITLCLALLLITTGTRPMPALAASYTVDSTADEADANVGDGVCATGSGSCTLRSAIQESNAGAGADTISVPAGTYTLSLAPLESANLDESGDYDVISGTLTIVGAGMDQTILAAGSPPAGSPPEQSALDRLLEIHPTAGNVTVSGVTFQGGWSEAEGGAIWNASPGQVTFSDVAVRDSVSTDYGGGIYNIGNLTLTNAALSANSTGGQGGAVFSDMGTLTVSNSSFTDNTADSGGAIYNGGMLSLTGLPSRVSVTAATFFGNSASTGGGIFIDQEGQLTLTDVTMAGNHAEDYGGGLALVQKASVTMLRAVFSENTAVGNGAGAYTGTERAVIITDSEFSFNQSGVVSAEGEPGDGGGAGLSTEGSGTVEITGITVFGNTSAGEGGGMYIDNNGAVSVSDSVFRDNHTESGGGGIENAGANVTFTRLTITGNKAVLDGGGIESQASGTFNLLDSNIYANVAENGGGFSNNADGALLISRSAVYDNRASSGSNDDTGLGGGIYVLGDAGITIENTTISGNFAQVRGGGLYVDADATTRVINTTISRNSSPVASGVGDEGTNHNVPIMPSTSVLFRNSIVAGNRMGSNCNYALGSEGGNVEDGDSCHFRGLRDRVNLGAGRVGLDAPSDNGGYSVTLALREESIAVDGGVAPCPPTDQRGIMRPLNSTCDSGAYEHEGPFAAPDTVAPDTQFLLGPVNDTEATNIFLFTGADDTTAADELLFECRLLEFDPTEPPEPPDPTAPPDPTLAWLGCPNPFQTPAQEEGTFTFEVRAVDRAGNVDPTPAIHNFTIALDLTPPDTFILEAPPNPSYGRSATFTFGGVDESTPAQFLEFECRIDTNDPEAWLECSNPTVFTDLTTGVHTVEARAADLGDNVDPTSAVYTWTVAPPANCDAANITLTASSDGWVDQVTPFDNLVLLSQLTVRSADLNGNARALVQFDIIDDAPGCILESATLRLYAGSSSEGRTLEAIPVAGAWAENTVTWMNQPATTGSPVTTTSGEGYREWDVTAHVIDMLEFGAANHGWMIRDTLEEDPEGGEQAFLSREYPQDPPPVTLPQLVLRYEPGVGGATAPLPPPAPVPATVVCGQVITTSTQVMNDLACLGEGLVIGAPNVHLDLNGHTISSALPVEPGEEDGLLAGIRNSGHANVIIANGAVLNYGYGVRLMGGAIFNVVENMTFSGSIVAGVELFDADDGRNGNVIRNNFFTRSGEASIALIGGSEGSQVLNNTMVGAGGYAVLIQDSNRHRVEGNSIDGFSLDPLIGSDSGIYLVGASDNVLVNNTITNTGDAGILVSAGSHRNRVEGNTINRTSDSGVSIADGDGNKVIDNVSHLNGGPGVGLSNAHGGEVSGNDVRYNPGGIELGGSNNNLIEGNDVSHSRADGIVIEGGLGNQVLDNLANGTRGSGIVVEGEAFDTLGNPIPGNIVQGNTANGNLGDGIAVSGGGHEVTGNAAHNNAAFGIAGSEGNVDGGGNTAGGNAEPEQCTFIACDTGVSAPALTPDLTGPDTIINSGPADPSDYLKVVFTFTGVDDTAPSTALHYECRLDAPPDPPVEPPEPPEPGEPPEPPPDPTDPESWHECASPMTYEYLQIGERTFEVRAIDPFDNVDFTQAVYTWTALDLSSTEEVDNTAPRTTIKDGPDDPTYETTATFSFRGTDNVTPGLYMAYECSLNGAPFAACPNPVTYPGLSPGPQTFAVQAKDLSGNVDATPATYAWTIEVVPPDETAPETTIDSQPDLMTVQTNATFTFSSNEEGVSFECSLDSTDFDPCSSPAVYQSLGVSSHEFRVRAIDAALNVDATPASYSWTVGPPPVPTTVACGDVLTQSTLVINSLMECLGDGLVIGADGITVDLNGNTLNGTGIGAGVLNNGFDLVTITNGAIMEFETGVLLNPGTAQNIVSHIRAELNGLAGIVLSNADDGVNGNTVRHNTLSGNGGGLFLINGTQGAYAHNNDIGGNAGQGVLMENSHGNWLVDNLITGSSDAGVTLSGSSNNRVLGNTISGSADAAVIIELSSNNNLIERNTVGDSEAGFNVSDSNGNELIANVVNFSGDNGISMGNANGSVIRGNDLRLNSTGIAMEGSSNNLIEANDTSLSSGFGIELGDLALNNVVSLNRSNDNDSTGIYVGAEGSAGTGNIIDRNTANNNSAGGILVTNIGHIVVGNTANYNVGWGIQLALPTIAGMNIDGGGNTALGNLSGAIDPFTLEMLQCSNVACNGESPLVADLLAPETTLLTTPPSVSFLTSAQFTFTGFDNATMVTFQCRLDGGTFSACSSPVSHSGLTVGMHIFEVRAVDWLGNSDTTPATFLWTIDPLPVGVSPQTFIDSGPDATTASTSATFNFSSDEPGVTYDCSLNGEPFATCASPMVYTGLAVGAQSFEVRATDVESLSDITPAAYAWTVVAPPAPTTVSCGQTLTQSTLVLNDLLDCPGDGLIIGASNITVDLGNRTIDGIGLGAGILNNGFDSVTVANGVVQEFDFGVVLNAGSNYNIISNLTLLANQDAGMQLTDADNAVLRANHVTSNNAGIWLLTGVENALVRDNTINGNSGDGLYLLEADNNRLEANNVTGSSGAGVYLDGSSNNVVTGNTLTANSSGGVTAASEEMEQGQSDNNVIELNIITANTQGIAVIDSNGNQLLNNTVQSNDGGISLDNALNTIVRGNDVRFNAGGIELSDASGSVIESNIASGSNGGGISVEGLSYNNLIRLNTVNGNSGDGLYVGTVAGAGQANVVERNRVNNNSGDGIFVAGGNSVANNTADFNDGWGIFAEPGNTDGGDNYATGNAEPTQCSGIACTIGTAPGAPDTTIVDLPPNPSNSRNALFTFIGADDTTALVDIGYECRLDSTSDLDWLECDNPQEYFALSGGVHLFEVRAVDQSGLVDQTPASYTWVYEPLPTGVAPDTFINLAPPPAAPIFEGFFTFSANEPDVTFECALDGGPFETCEFAYEYAFEEFDVGTHTFQVRATDFEGNTDLTPASYTWSVVGIITTVYDGPAYIPPSEPGEFAEGGETESTTATFVFAANVADATYMCSLDLATFVACSSPLTYTGLAVGEHQLRIIATDPEGELVEIEPAVYEWAVILTADTTAPETTLTGTPANLSSDTTFTFSAVDDQTQPLALTFECRLDSVLEADWISCVSPFNLLTEFPEFAAGTHTFEVRAIDDADPDGNIDPTPASYTWTATADITPPDTVLLTMPAATTIEIDVEFTFAGSDATTPELSLTFECALDGSPFEPCDSPENVQGMLPGVHTFEVRAVDLALNADQSPAAFSWTVIGAPETTLTITPPLVDASTTATFEFVSDQVDATFLCSLDGAPAVACTSPAVYPDLAGAIHEFQVQAVNAYGLMDEEPAYYTWEVQAPPDTTAPDTTILTGPPAVTLATVATFTFSSSEAGSTFECALNGGSFNTCAPPHEVNGLEVALHNLQVRAIDSSGNIDPSPASYSWEVDGPPVTTIDSGPDESTDSTSATFTFSSNEPATYDCWLDGVITPLCTSPITYTGLAVGPHEFAVLSTDLNGNISLDWVDYEWDVLAPPPPDLTPPDSAVDQGPLPLTTDTVATFTFSANEPDTTFECAVNGMAFVGCNSPTMVTGLAVGTHTFQVRGTDPAGNTESSPATYTWTVQPPPDVTPPETTIGSAPSSPTTSTSASFSFSANESGTFQCALDGAAFSSCTSPISYSSLAAGAHTFQVRAVDGAANVDDTPASHSWTVSPPVSCGSPVTVYANADAWIEQNSPSNNKGSDSGLKVKAQGTSDNFRAMVRFPLPAVPAGCMVDTATLRLFSPSWKNGRTIQAIRLNSNWTEMGVTWANQPATSGAAATTSSGSGYRQWAVAAQVQTMYSSGNFGFLIRDSVEGGGGNEQEFNAREKGENRPMLIVSFKPILAEAPGDPMSGAMASIDGATGLASIAAVADPTALAYPALKPEVLVGMAPAA